MAAVVIFGRMTQLSPRVQCIGRTASDAGRQTLILIYAAKMRLYKEDRHLHLG